MPEAGTVVGLTIAGVAVVGAAVIIGVAIANKNGSGADNVTIVKRRREYPRNPWYDWDDYPMYVGNGGRRRNHHGGRRR